MSTNQQPYAYKRRSTTREILNNDQDREDLFQKIVELFIAAGYFRARIQSLEPFDKILGGIAWTLTGSNCDVDLDFKDEMNLAEKIKISEKITAALKSLNCPFILNPVQLQGLDLPIIFQVVQWLVKKQLEVRDERNAINRNNAKNYYTTKFISKDTKNYQNVKEKIIDFKYNYISTGRQFRPTNKTNFEYNDPLRIYFALIEHGLGKDLSFQRTLIDLLKKKNLIDQNDSKKENSNISHSKIKDTQLNQLNQLNQLKDQPIKDILLSNEEKNKLEEILSTNIQEVKSEVKNFQRVNTKVIEEIFSENINIILTEIDRFENLKEDENVDKIKLFVKEKERLDNKKMNILFQIKEYESELENISENINNANDNILESNKQTEILNSTLKENNNNLEKLNIKIKTAKVSEEKMRVIGEKIKQREDIKLAMSNFKKDCLDEKKSYDTQLEFIEKKIEKMNDSQNTQVFEEIDRNYNLEYERMLLKKKDLFDQNKIINLLTRKIQVFPSKLELIQYQRRFQELYDQINHVSEKSRKVLNEINSRDEVNKLLNQKLEIFIQLKDAYKNSKSKKDKENFKESLNNILNSIAESIRKSTDRLRQYNKQIDENQTKLNSLQSYENNYMKLIKEYNKEYIKCNKTNI